MNKPKKAPIFYNGETRARQRGHGVACGYREACVRGDELSQSTVAMVKAAFRLWEEKQGLTFRPAQGFGAVDFKNRE